MTRFRARLLSLTTCLLLTVSASSFSQPGQGPAKVVLGEVGERVIAPTAHRTGVLRFDRITQVSPEVEGSIIQMRLSDGLKLKQGEEIARLNTDFLDQDRMIAQAEMDEVQARIEQKATELKRLRTLRKEAVASRSAYDEARFELKALRAQKEGLMQRSKRLALETERSIIRAPFDGVVLERLQDVGEWAKPDNALGRIAATDYVLAVFPIPESLVPYQVKSSEMDIDIPALEKTLKGFLVGFVSHTEVRTRSVYLKIQVPYVDGMLENLTVEADIPSGKPQTLRTIPRDALLQQAGPNTVYTVKEGKAKAVTFEIDLRDGDVIATSDAAISKGMKVVIDGNERLKAGQDVLPVEASAKAIGTEEAPAK